MSRSTSVRSSDMKESYRRSEAHDLLFAMWPRTTSCTNSVAQLHCIDDPVRVESAGSIRWTRPFAPGFRTVWRPPSLHVCFGEFLVAIAASTYVGCALRPAIPDLRISAGELPEMAASRLIAQSLRTPQSEGMPIFGKVVLLLRWKCLPCCCRFVSEIIEGCHAV